MFYKHKHCCLPSSLFVVLYDEVFILFLQWQLCWEVWCIENVPFIILNWDWQGFITCISISTGIHTQEHVALLLMLMFWYQGGRPTAETPLRWTIKKYKLCNSMSLSSLLDLATHAVSLGSRHTLCPPRLLHNRQYPSSSLSIMWSFLFNFI